MIYISCTIKELAKACGVSEGTVDRAVNNRSGIRESTKQHILEMAEQMDYQIILPQVLQSEVQKP